MILPPSCCQLIWSSEQICLLLSNVHNSVSEEPITPSHRGSLRCQCQWLLPSYNLYCLSFRPLWHCQSCFCLCSRCMLTHSNYNSLAQQDVSQGRSVTVSLEAPHRNLAWAEPELDFRCFEAKQNIYLHENFCNCCKWRKESLFSALTEILAADMQDDLEIFW